MLVGNFFGLVEILYYLSFLLLAGLTLFIAWRGRRVQTRLGLRRTFFGLVSALLLWQISLFLEAHSKLPSWQLWLGRINFTAMAIVAALALLFVEKVSSASRSRFLPYFVLETCLLVGVTLLTPWVDATEWVEAGHPSTRYGPGFSLYRIHVIGYLAAALIVALRRCLTARHPAVRKQLMVIAIGMFATGGVASVANALLPFSFHDFRYCDVGTLSTIFFLLAVAYSTFVYRLFSVRKLLHATLIYGILLAFVLGTYSSSVFLLTQYLTDHAGQWTKFCVLLIAFSFDPLRRFLEKQTDHWLFSRPKDHTEHPQQKRPKMHLLLALLFPWRHN